MRQKHIKELYSDEKAAVCAFCGYPYGTYRNLRDMVNHWKDRKMMSFHWRK